VRARTQLSLAGEPDRDHRTVRLVARSHPRLCRHRLARPRRLFRLRLLRRRPDRQVGWGEPLTGLVIAAAAAGLLGYLTSFIIARFRHLALIMITLGLGLLLAEAANSASWLTGGADGLQGVRMWKLLGLFEFDIFGTTAYSYSLVVLFLVFLVARRL